MPAMRRRATRALVQLGILRELQALDGSLALLGNVPNDVSNGVRLVLEMTICHIGKARRRHALVGQGGTPEVGLGLRGEALVGGTVLLAILVLSEARLDFRDELVRLGERADKVFHVMALSADEAAQVEHNAARLVPLPKDRGVGVLQRRELLLVTLALALQLFGNLLLEHERLEGVIALLLSAVKTHGKACIVVLLLVQEAGEAPVLPLVGLNLRLEILGFFRELFSKGLELQELHKV